MRIVYLNPSGQMGGAETSLRELLASTRAAAPDWELWLVLAEDGPMAGLARDLGVRVVLAPFPRTLARLGDTGGRVARILALLQALPATGLYAIRLAKILRSIQASIIHSNGLKMHLLAAWARPRRTPLVWHIHDYVRSRPMMSRLLRRSSGACTAAIANSKSVAADLSQLMPALRIVPIYNAIDLQRFSPSGAKFDLDAGSDLGPAVPGTVRIGLVATFARWKGHKVFLQALARLPEDLPARGYVIGGPIYQTQGSQWSRAELEQEAERLGIAHRVVFTGFIQDTAAAMRSLDVIVHASTEPEPFGMVIIEGMASGKAVIASAAGGAAELFVHSEDALAHSPGDAAGLAKEIERLARNEQLRVRLGQAGRARVEKLFHGRRLATELIALYRDIAGGPALSPSAAAIPACLGAVNEESRIRQ